MSQPSYPQPFRPRDGSSAYETRRDIDAALAAQRELGPEYNEHLAAGLADRVEQLAAYRTAEIRQAQERDQQGSSLVHSGQRQRFLLGIWSVVAGIPVTAIATSNGGVVETAICWAGIVGVNVAQAMGAGRRR